MKSKWTKTFLLIGSFWLAASNCAAQKPKKNVLPRVGFIKYDEKISQGKEGCGNHIIFYPKVDGGGGEVFNSDHEGFNAWMNFEGRNVELRLIKTTLYHRGQFEAKAFYEYRYKNISVTVSLLQSFDYVFSSPAKIVVRNGRAARTMRGVVTPQCDAL